MESANHSHHLNAADDDDHHSSSSNSLATTTPSAWYGTPAPSNNHAWTPNSISTLNTSNQLYQNLNEDPYISTVYSTHNNKDHHPLIRDVTYNWTNTTSSNNNVVESLQLGKSETEEIQHLFPKFTDMMMMNTLTSSSAAADSSSFRQYQFPGLEFSMPLGRMNFSSPVLPSVNVSSLNQSSSSGCSLDMNLQALDFLASARFSGANSSVHQPSSSHDDLGLEDERHSLFPQQHQKSSPSHQLLSPFINGAPDEKRSSNAIAEPKESQSAPKKSRLEPICRKPLKVRKEKLGDRITALQQLVAPFGKTDTASVLMEAYGYIKFLQNQVETLSVPYMKKSHCNRATRSSSQMNNAGQGRTVVMDDQGNEVAGNRDLRSRGLCLVPLSCLSYVNTDGCGEGAWPPNDYGG